jgi:alanine-synthesizing transaminase
MLSKIVPAERTENILYAIRDIVVLANEVAKSGKELLYLNIGDPNLFDFAPPKHVVEATHSAMLQNHNGYAPSSGIQSALDAIARLSEKKGIKNIQDIFITTGASEAIDLCLTALVNEGENVLTPTPGYPMYTAIANKLRNIENPYFLKEENGWQPDINDIRKKINNKTRAIVLINPNNPTGVICNTDTLKQVIELAKEHNLVILADEIYDKLLFEEDKYISIASLDSEVPMISFGGLSKNFMVPGFRIGWGVVSGNKNFMADYVEAINKLLRARLSANHPEQYAIAAALDGDQSHLVEAKKKLTARRDLTVQMLNDIPGISCIKPEGAFYAFPAISANTGIKSDNHFVAELIKETGVVVVPGTGFGQVDGTYHFRVVFLPPEEILEKAYRKIAVFADKYFQKQAV